LSFIRAVSTPRLFGWGRANVRLGSRGVQQRGKLQERYGIEKDKAERELDDFTRSLNE
jgi:hypothetical protein